jgi:hypothetical protein
MKLYEINAKWDDIMDRLEENEGELTRELEHEMIELMAQGQQNLERRGMVIKENAIYISGIDAEIRRLQKKKKTLKTVNLWLKNSIVTAMEMMGKKKIESHQVEMSLRASSYLHVEKVVDAYPDDAPVKADIRVSVEVKDKEAIIKYAKAYALEIASEIIVDKAEAKKYIKAGNQLPGCHIVPRNSLTIK